MNKTEAINAYCKGCIYDNQEPGNWHQQVEACTVTHCELYEHRPITGATKRLLKEERIANMSPEELAKYRQKQDQARERFKPTP